MFISVGIAVSITSAVFSCLLSWYLIYWLVCLDGEIPHDFHFILHDFMRDLSSGLGRIESIY